jgi:hypothetical protein
VQNGSSSAIAARCRRKTKANGFPKRLGDLAFLVTWNEGLPTGPARLLARRAEVSGRAAELLGRSGVEGPGPASAPAAATPRHTTAARA